MALSRLPIIAAVALSLCISQGIAAGAQGSDRPAHMRGVTQAWQMRGMDRDHDRDRDQDRGHGRGEHHRFRGHSILVYPYSFYYLDAPYLYRNTRVYYTPASGSLTMADIVYMAGHGVTDDEIIDRIESSSTVFRLTAADIAYLRANRVDSAVIDAMLDTPFTIR